MFLRENMQHVLPFFTSLIMKMFEKSWSVARHVQNVLGLFYVFVAFEPRV